MCVIFVKCAPNAQLTASHAFHLGSRSGRGFGIPPPTSVFYIYINNVKQTNTHRTNPLCKYERNSQDCSPTKNAWSIFYRLCVFVCHCLCIVCVGIEFVDGRFMGGFMQPQRILGSCVANESSIWFMFWINDWILFRSNVKTPGGVYLQPSYMVFKLTIMYYFRIIGNSTVHVI